jgi:hypothetical protein
MNESHHPLETTVAWRLQRGPRGCVSGGIVCEWDEKWNGQGGRTTWEGFRESWCSWRWVRSPRPLPLFSTPPPSTTPIPSFALSDPDRLGSPSSLSAITCPRIPPPLFLVTWAYMMLRNLVSVVWFCDRLDDPLMWGFKGFPLFDVKLARWVLAAEDICFKNALLSYFFRLGM